jgi:hypothetical protein
MLTRSTVHVHKISKQMSKKLFQSDIAILTAFEGTTCFKSVSAEQYSIDYLTVSSFNDQNGDITMKKRIMHYSPSDRSTKILLLSFTAMFERISRPKLYILESTKFYSFEKRPFIILLCDCTYFLLLYIYVEKRSQTQEEKRWYLMYFNTTPLQDTA